LFLPVSRQTRAACGGTVGGVMFLQEFKIAKINRRSSISHLVAV